MNVLIADHKAELKNHAPKPTKTAKQKMKIAVCTFSFQKRRDLKITNATTAYHMKSQSQCTTVNTEKPNKPNICAFIINAVPIVIHHKMKPGLTAVVHIPANNESCLGTSTFWLVSPRFLNVLTPMYIISKPPTTPTTMGTASGMANWLSQK